MWVWLVIWNRIADHMFRLVYTTKIMHIGSELICTVYVGTEFALTAIHFEFAFSQSTSIGGLKPVWGWIVCAYEVMWVRYICMISNLKK